LAIAYPKHDIRFGVYYSATADWGHSGGGTGEKKWDTAQEGNYDQYINTIAVSASFGLIMMVRPE
jgi:hypothetical protein